MPCAATECPTARVPCRGVRKAADTTACSEERRGPCPAPPSERHPTHPAVQQGPCSCSPAHADALGTHARRRGRGAAQQRIGSTAGHCARERSASRERVVESGGAQHGQVHSQLNQRIQACFSS